MACWIVDLHHRQAPWAYSARWLAFLPFAPERRTAPGPRVADFRRGFGTLAEIDDRERGFRVGRGGRAGC